MVGQRALRRWDPFFEAFDHVDAAIEAAAGPALSRGEFRRARGQIVDLLRNAPEEAQAEELCIVLDEAMALSLLSLESVPAEAVPRILASSADLAKAVGALRGHESAQVRALAGDIVRGWKVAVEADIVRTSAAMAKLDALSSRLLPSEGTATHISGGRSDDVPADHDAKMRRPAPATKIEDNQPRSKKTSPVAGGTGRVTAAEGSDPLPRKTTPVAAVSRCVRTENTKSSTNTPESLPKKTPPFVCRAAGDGRVVARSGTDEKKMEATKRKLHEGYQEAADAKRQRKIRVIEAPRMVEQRQRKMHPIMRERSRAICGSSTTVRRSLMSSLVS